MTDITFYDLEFNKLRILPQYAVNLSCGYIAINAKKEFNGLGSFEIDFLDEETRQIIEEHSNGTIIDWNGFPGLVTGYLFEDGHYKITGLSLNALLHRAVIPKTATVLSGDAETLARNAVSGNISWLTLGQVAGLTKNIKYSTDSYKAADEYIKELLDLDDAGYEVTADFVNESYVFSVVKTKENNLILSQNLMNAYEFSESCDNKTKAIGGWYPKQSDTNTVWTYITTDNTVTGIDKIDTVLTATTAEEALQELKQRQTIKITEFKTKNIVYGRDYNLGDVVRVQNNGITVQKKITGVMLSQEIGYAETPILSEVESNG